MTEAEVKKTLEEALPESQEPTASVESEASAVAEEVARLQAEVELWKDRALRSAAELENYRRRVQRDLQQQILSAQMDILRPLLPLLDNIERGIQAAREAPDMERLKEGLELIHRQFSHTLQKLSIQVIAPEVGSLPDPAYHEVISTVPAPEGVQPHTIVEVVEAGYLYQGQLLRPARVITTE
ncbi:MAG: nucleotide exchange factor GrpE [Bacteroidia bacterium]|nr:nucleotide exchange factor GrpE [Bacteroidia bacterium]MCX7764356.1 nucleotide exchange factor GrpE [Bacteroidia bacterium]MDW8057285.1 nucleotide exchange factor GrpE [Bacteroidia bacterium]